MALRFADGFDQYDTDDLTGWWTQVYDGGADYDPVIAATTGRRGGRCVRFDGNTANALGRVLSDATGTTAVFGFAFRGVTSTGGVTGWGGIFPWNSSGSLYPAWSVSNSFLTASPFNFIASLRNDGATHIALCLETNGTISVVLGDAAPLWVVDPIDSPTTKLGTTTEALHFDEWHYIECKVVLHASAGSVTLKVDGDTWLSLTSINTLALNGGTAAFDELVIGRNRGNGSNSAWLFDDVYLVDTDTSDASNVLADFLGDIAVSWVQPTADGDVNNWTASSGSARYDMVNEVPPDDDTTYIQSNTPAHVNTFATSGVPIAGATILAVGVMFAARRTEGGQSQTQPVVRIAGVTYAIGAAKGNTTSYSYQAGFISVKPSDHTAISEADFAAMQPGVKKVL